MKCPLKEGLDLLDNNDIGHQVKGTLLSKQYRSTVPREMEESDPL